ncbi:MAG: triose-phosphate isomerase [Candidatus Pacearchaeota archaeon]|jgi:triosephosphate isomerase
MKPIILVNLKTYQTGLDSVKISKIIATVDKNILVAAQASDIYEITKSTKLKVYSQHVDPFEPGRNTGFILPEAIKKDGAIGTLLNHSEHKLDLKTIKETIIRCKKIKLKTMVFAKDLKEAKQIKKFNPDFIIYEPPELVAGNISVSESKPQVISDFAKKLNKDFLVGAGIKTNQDLKKSIELGAKGIALASAITTAKNPKKVLKDLIKLK